MEEIKPLFTPYDLRNFYNSLSIWKVLKLFMIICIFGYQKLKNTVLFLNLLTFPIF